jgi:ABC-type branched-subunit amino acid transport system permease subunit
MSATSWAAWLGFALAGLLALVFGGMLLLLRGVYLKAAPTIKSLAALQRTTRVSTQTTTASGYVADVAPISNASANVPTPSEADVPAPSSADLKAAGLVAEDK